MEAKHQILYNADLYLRLSREDGDKAESESITGQRELLLAFLEKHPEIRLHSVRVDDGYSGVNFNRPEFKRMLRDIEEGKVNCVIVKDLSRFGRDYIDTGRYLERIFPDLNVRFISVTDNIDSMKHSYDMLLPIKNIFNEQYARDISKKVYTAVKTKQEAGEFIGSFASYGYKKSPSNKNKLVIDDYAAGIVREIFSLYIKGYGKQKIAGILNSKGILCPAEYKRAMGLNYRNPNKLDSTVYWSYSTINSILHREMYTGNMVQGTRHQHMRGKQKKQDKENWIVVENTHEPVIDRATWEKSQSLLKKRTRKLDLETSQNIFAGFVKCGDCGRAMAKNLWRRKDGTSNYVLYCGTYKSHGKQYCSPHTLPLKDLEEIVLNDLKVIVQNAEDLNGLIKSQDFVNFKDSPMMETELGKVKLELERLKRMKKSIYEDYKEDLISKEEYISYREDYQRKESLFLKQRETLEEKKKRNTAGDVFRIPWIKNLLKLKTIPQLDRDIIAEMIDHITVYENHKIKISYNFGKELEPLFSHSYRIQ